MAGNPREQTETERDYEPCNECGSLNLVTDYNRGETVCAGCGIVIVSHSIDRGAEWRAYSIEQLNKRSRVGNPATHLLHDKGLSTVIDWQDKDALGKMLPPRRRQQIFRLRKWQRRARITSSWDRNLVIAMPELERLSSQLDVPYSIRETAAILYRQAVEKQLVRGRSIELVVAAALYIACRKCKIPWKLEEIAQHSSVNAKNLGRCYLLLLKKLGLNVPPISPTEYIPPIGSKLLLSNRTQQRAAILLTLASAKNITMGKDPAGLAGAALYIAGVLEQERRTQREVALAARVTEVTIRSRYKKLAEHLDIHLKL